MITTDEAIRVIFANVSSLEPVSKPLSESYGSILAGDVFADRDLPPADRSAMDGYAVRAEDIKECPRVLTVTGEIAAGIPANITVDAGCCVRIFTGAVIPDGADTVVMVEDTEESGGAVTFKNPVPFGKNIRYRGEETKKGDLIFSEGDFLGAAQIGLCASVGVAEPKVYSRPRIAVLCTGKELRDASESVLPHEIRNSNGPALCAALESWGFGSVKHKVLPDNPEIITEELKRVAVDHEVILLTGGVSVGKYDFVPGAVENIGAKIRFHKVAVKPGKPLLYATLSDNRHIFGLPGNPLSVMSGFCEFVLPALKCLSGIPESRSKVSMFLPLSGEVGSKPDRALNVLARIQWSPDGPAVSPLKSCGSADLSSGSFADGVIVVPVNAGKLSPGTMVEFRPWRPLP
ncbi:gephyrin-like molybdotransferase Glp [Candidatus Latescibacterota bacterium]